MHHLTKNELLPVLRVACAHDTRHWLMFLVAYWHGFRATEVVTMQGGQVQDGFVTMQRLKGSLKTVQPLITHSDELLSEKRALEELSASVGIEGRMFPYTRQWFWKLFKIYGAEAGVPAFKCHPHVMKHSIAMHTIKEAGIENVRQYLGHKDISSTGEYLKVSDDSASKAIAQAVGV